MTVQDVLEQLAALGDEKVRARNTKAGAEGEQFGVKRGDVRKLAKAIKHDQALGLALWETGNIDARFLAVLLIKPAKLSAEDVNRLVRSVRFDHVADWLNNYIVRHHKAKESLRQTWMSEDDPMAGRAGWSLTAERVAKKPDGLDLGALLDRIEAELADAAPTVQWTMNMCLVEIGVHQPDHRERAIAIGEALGVYGDYPVPRGCTSPFAPSWIREMVRRQG